MIVTLVRSTNTRARVKVTGEEIRITIPVTYTPVEEYAFMELCGEINIPKTDKTFRGRDSMGTVLVLQNDSRTEKIIIEKDMI